MTREEFIARARLKHGDKYDYSEVEYKNNYTKVCIICPEHGPFLQTPSNHLMGRGCSECRYVNISNMFRSNTEEFIKKAREVHGSKYDYSNVEYVNNHTKVCIVCPVHGEFKQMPSGHLNGKGCSDCKQSNMEKLVRKILEDKNINFTYNEYNFEWLRDKARLQLDFYLSDYNVAIECQGRQHFEVIDHFGGKNGLKETQERDCIKKNLCEEYGIKLYYISYNDNVEEKMNNILKELLEI
jgi:hypothetical protein